MAGGDGERTWLHWAALLAMIAGISLVLTRGVVRGSHPSTSIDTALVLTGARAWFEGRNPYLLEDIATTWQATGGDPDRAPLARGPQSLVYPPSGWAVMAPISLVGARWLIPVWLTTNVALWALTAAGAVSLARLSWKSPHAWLLMGLGLALGAAHTSLMLGQTAVLIAALVVWGQALRQRGNLLAAGALLGLAAVVKPQLAALFVVYEAGRGRWRVVAAAVAAGAAVMAIGVLRLELAGVEWRALWRANLRSFAIGGEADPLALQEKAYMIVSLDGPLSLLLHQRWALLTAVWATVGVMCAAYAWVDLQRRRTSGERQAFGSELASLSMVSVATLLVVYHRYYDATLLLFPLALSVMLLARGRRWQGLTTLAILAPLMAPLPAALVRLERVGFMPTGLADSTLWKLLALGSHTWALVALGVWLVWIRATATAPARVEAPSTDSAAAAAPG